MLVVLTLGAAVTGLVLAPPSADLAVHNAAGENLAASTLNVQITQTQSQHNGKVSNSAPPVHVDVVVHPGTVPNVQTQEGQDAEFVLSVLQRISTHTPWAASGGSYRFTGSFAALAGVPSSYEGSAPSGGVVRVKVIGTSRVWVSGGYAVGILLQKVETADGGRLSATLTQVLRFRQIDGYTPDLSHISAST